MNCDISGLGRFRGRILVLCCVLVSSLALLTSAASAEEIARPNVLFISLDDLNSWVGCLGGHPQAKTPNLDWLAKSGVLFTNAHCSAAQCNPSRASLFTGISPHVSGLYDNRQKMREIMPNTEILPKVMMNHGYQSMGSGKLLHYFIDSPSWNDYFPEAAKENPFPRTMSPQTRPLSLPVAGAWHYRETDWGSLQATDDEYGGDYLVAKWVAAQLLKKHDKPFFLGCGIYRPHEPWFVPAKYFEPFPLESIQLPPGYKSDDLDDLPPEGKRRAPNQYFDHIQKEGQWKRGIQAYLAAIYFADCMLGEVLDALEKGPHAQDTIVILWSDHGWHLGEKEHWQKYTAWRQCTRVPLIIRVPTGTSALPSGTTPGVCDQPVSLLSLAPTLLQLCGLPPVSAHDAPSLVPLLQDANANWPHVAVTFLGDRGSYGLSSQDWRLIHYANGEEELYHITQDPYEWRNLAELPEYQAKRIELRKQGPTKFAPKPTPAVATSPAAELPWNPVSGEKFPSSRPKGTPFEVNFENHHSAAVGLYWVDPEGKLKHYADIPPGKSRRQKTRSGVIWLIKGPEDEPLGFFQIADHMSKAVVPKIRSEKE